MEIKGNKRVIDSILERFNLEELCPLCSGPLELGENRCLSCKTKARVREYLIQIETGIMNIRDSLGVRQPSRLVPLPLPEPPAKKPARTTKPRSKKGKK